MKQTMFEILIKKSIRMIEYVLNFNTVTNFKQMKYINLKYLSFLTIFTIFATSCSNFEEMNINPNKPVSVPTSGLLTQAEANLVYNFNGELAQLGEQYVQHLTQVDYVEKSNYNDDGISSFSGIYRGGLNDLKDIIRINKDENLAGEVVKYGDNVNQIAVATILTTWAYHNMTDVWGDIPYSEALNDEILTPKYDTQESIYDALIAKLDNAISTINTTPTIGLQGDLIFDGDMAQWKKFAVSLRLRIAMRLSEVNSSKASSLISDADFANAFTSSADVAEFKHLATDAEANPLYIDNVVNAGADNFAVANTLIDAMQAFNDPRIPMYANASVTSGTYVGLTYGVGATNADDISFPGDMYAAQEAPSILMTAAEVLFIKAEAAQRGYITGDAATFYNEAITASMEYNGVSAADIASYLAQPSVVYDAANWKKSIGTQKWIALYGVGIQAWAEWRRLGFPVLALAPAATTTTIPLRRAYPSDEYSTNSANIMAAVASSLGGKDLFTTSVWWDK